MRMVTSSPYFSLNNATVSAIAGLMGALSENTPVFNKNVNFMTENYFGKAQGDVAGPLEKLHFCI